MHARPLTVTLLPLTSPFARQALLSSVVTALDESDAAQLAAMGASGLTPQVVDRLRALSVLDSYRIAAAPCGLMAAIDASAMSHRLDQVDQERRDRQTYEYLIKAGASIDLLQRLYAVRTDDLRRRRKILAPEVCQAGRPRNLDDATAAEIAAVWSALCASEPSERQRYVLLHRHFAGAYRLAELEQGVPSASGPTASSRPGLAPSSLRTLSTVPLTPPGGDHARAHAQ